MKRKNEAQQQRESEAIEENIKLAKESGNKLTQNITEDGQLVGVGQVNTTVNALSSKEEVSGADIRKELFEGNVVLPNKKDT